MPDPLIDADLPDDFARLPGLEPDPEPIELGAAALDMLTKSLELIDATLALKRAERDEANALIRQLVEDRETVRQAIGAWTRAARRRPADAD
jgi:hypothetical protein